jgi:hypothetical protein
VNELLMAIFERVNRKSSSRHVSVLWRLNSGGSNMEAVLYLRLREVSHPKSRKLKEILRRL